MIQLSTIFTLAIFQTAPTSSVDQVLNCVCYSRPDKEACFKERREDVTESLKIISEVVSTFETPPFVRALMPAIACGESGLRKNPTCGGRISCNDYGTSSSWYQIKLSERKGSLRWVYKEENGSSLDTTDLRETTRFYLNRLIWGVHNKVRRICGWKGRSLEEIWSIAAIRLGRGPILYWTDPPVGQKRKAVQRCSPKSRYVALALSWYKKCPKCWESHGDFSIK
tara:strand:+ start:2329 stop:3003 length:675 start_codon:yes stop_codon:yes gene_type:complete